MSGNSESVALNLHYHAEWTSVQAHNDCDAHSPFVAHYTGFHVSASPHRDYNRSQTTVEKIDKLLFLVRLMKTEMIGQVNKLQLLAYSLLLGIGYNLKKPARFIQQKLYVS